MTRRATSFAAIMVSLIAAYVSYRHAYQLARDNGENAWSAWAIPLTIDGQIFAASMVLLQAAKRERKAPLLAWLALGLGIVATGFANVEHGVPFGWTGMLVSAWPAVALVVTFEMLLRVNRAAAQLTEQAAPIEPPVPVEPTEPVGSVSPPKPKPAPTAPIVPTVPNPAPAPPPVSKPPAPTVPPAPPAPPAPTVPPKPIAPVPVPPVRPHLVPASPEQTDRYTLGVQLYRKSVHAGAPMSKSELAKALGMTNRKLAARIVDDHATGTLPREQAQ